MTESLQQSGAASPVGDRRGLRDQPLCEGCHLRLTRHVAAVHNRAIDAQQPDHRIGTDLLGYPADAGLLIINADDFGICHATNAAIIQTLQAGQVRSTTLMVPCPWALHAMYFLADHPETAFGVHLTVISEWRKYRWGPVTPRDKVPSLIDQAGYFYKFEQMPEMLAGVNLDELEMEFRAQIAVVLGAGLKPTHLDWHCLRLSGRTDIPDLMLALAREYGLALRVARRTFIEKVQALGPPTYDTDYLLNPSDKPAQLAQLLRDLPAGLTEWAVHPGLDCPEFLAIERANKHERQKDFELLTSQTAKDIVREVGLVLLDYRVLQAVWKTRDWRR
ncbi:MAG: polysaccharide deacetylase family protein [Anaerolineales bacterium]